MPACIIETWLSVRSEPGGAGSETRRRWCEADRRLPIGPARESEKGPEDGSGQGRGGAGETAEIRRDEASCPSQRWRGEKRARGAISPTAESNDLPRTELSRQTRDSVSI